MQQQQSVNIISQSNEAQRKTATNQWRSSATALHATGQALWGNERVNSTAQYSLQLLKQLLSTPPQNAFCAQKGLRRAAVVRLTLLCSTRRHVTATSLVSTCTILFVLRYLPNKRFQELAHKFVKRDLITCTTRKMKSSPLGQGELL